MFFGILSLCAITACVFATIYLDLSAEIALFIGAMLLIIISGVRVTLTKSRKIFRLKNIIQERSHRVASIRKANSFLTIVHRKRMAPLAPDNSGGKTVKPIPRRKVFERRIGSYSLLFYSRRKPRWANRIWERPNVRRVLWSQWLGTLLMGLAQMIPMAMLLLILGRASEVNQDDYLRFLTITVIYAILTALSGGLLLYLALTSAYRRNWHWGISLLLVLPIFLSILSESSGMLPMTVMRITKNGNFRAEKIILSPKTCSVLAPTLGIRCESAGLEPIVLCNVHVMTRVGPETYLRLAGKEIEGEKRNRVERIFIPTSDIIGMSVNFDLKYMLLKKLDDDLSRLSSICSKDLTILEGDSSFNFNDFTLTNEGMTKLTEFVSMLLEASTKVDKIIITGHADQIGTDQANKDLSLRRAQEVRNFLQEKLRHAQAGIPLVVDAKGSRNPIVTGCSREKNRVACESPNRRVELRIIKKELTPDSAGT